MYILGYQIFGFKQAIDLIIALTSGSSHNIGFPIMKIIVIFITITHQLTYLHVLGSQLNFPSNYNKGLIIEHWGGCPQGADGTTLVIGYK